LIIDTAWGLQSIQAPGDYLRRLAATSVDSHGVTRSFKDTCASI
jgi:hypothetical protein